MNSLISQDSKFSKKHLRLSISSHHRHHLIRIPTQFLKEWVLSYSPISSIFSSASTTSVKQQFSFSITNVVNRGYYRNRISTCDGIICYKLNESLAVLCNPSIRKFKMLPPLEFSGQLITQYTLVYDRFTDNYKIIALNKGCSRKEVSIHIHTLGTDYWRRIPHFPALDLIPMAKIGVFVNDSVNWVACDNVFPSFIVSLDLEKESCQKLSLPADVQFRRNLWTLGTLSGCLSFLIPQRVKFCDVWIMKDYGNKNSWTKLLTVPYIVECDFYGYSRVLYTSEDGKVLMEYSRPGKNNLSVYDSINNTSKILKFHNYIRGEIMTHEVYVESLISPL